MQTLRILLIITVLETYRQICLWKTLENRLISQKVIKLQKFGGLLLWTTLHIQIAIYKAAYMPVADNTVNPWREARRSIQAN